MFMNHNYYFLHTSAERLPRAQFIYEEPCMKANGNTITSFARELNPTGVGEHIYIYIYRERERGPVYLYYLIKHAYHVRI